MFIESDKTERRVNQAVGALANAKSFKRDRQFGKVVNGAIEGGTKMVLWQIEPNGWDEV